MLERKLLHTWGGRFFFDFRWFVETWSWQKTSTWCGNGLTISHSPVCDRRPQTTALSWTIIYVRLMFCHVNTLGIGALLGVGRLAAPRGNRGKNLMTNSTWRTSPRSCRTSAFGPSLSTWCWLWWYQSFFSSFPTLSRAVCVESASAWQDLLLWNLQQRRSPGKNPRTCSCGCEGREVN